MKLPSYVIREKYRGIIYRPYKGRVNGRIKWGKRIKLADLDASEEEIWQAYRKVTSKKFKGKPGNRKAWLDQKANAKRRGIPFHFPYECWLQWWGDDISKRGCHSGELVMARFGDAGAYVMANVYKATCNHNSGVRW